MADPQDELPQPTSEPRVNESFLLQQLQAEATSALSRQQQEAAAHPPPFPRTSELLSQQPPEFLHKLLQAQYRQPPFQEVLMPTTGELRDQPAEAYSQPGLGPSDVGDTYTQPGPSDVGDTYTQPGPSDVRDTYTQPGASHVGDTYTQPGPSDGRVSYSQPGPSDGSYSQPVPSDGRDSYSQPRPSDGRDSYSQSIPSDGRDSYSQPRPSDVRDSYSPMGPSDTYSHMAQDHTPPSPSSAKLEPRTLLAAGDPQFQSPQALVIHDGSLEPKVSTQHESLEMSVQQVSPVSSGSELIDSEVYKVVSHQPLALKLEAGYGDAGQEYAGLDVEQQQKLELDSWRKTGSERVQLVHGLQGATRVVNTVTPQPPPTQEKNAYNKNHLLSILNQTLVQFCHDNLYFVEFAHITGRFSFNLDNRETMHLVVSQMTTPAAFQDKATPVYAKKTKDAKPFTPSTGVSSALTPPKKRGRGRPRKIDTYAGPVKVKMPPVTPAQPKPGRGRPRKRDVYVAPVTVKPPPVTPDDAQPGPSTSGSSGGGRRAATQAKQRLRLIAHIRDNMEQSDAEDSEDEDSLLGSVSNFDPADTDETDDEYIPDTTNRTSSRSQSCPSVHTSDPGDEGMAAPLSAIPIKTEQTEDRGAQQLEQTDTAGVVELAEDTEAVAKSLDEARAASRSDEDVGGQISPREVPVQTSGMGDFPCPRCAQRFATEDAMRLHVSKHKTFYCVDPACRSQEFFTRGEIRKHFRSVHGKGAKHLHRCKTCRQEFLTRDQLKEHTQSAHSHICSVCGETFSSKATLKKHKDSSHLEMSCTICGRNFISRAAFNRHIRRHKEKAAGKIKCDECDKEFTAHSSLFHHKKAMHRGIKPYSCDQCGMTFNFNNSLKLHKLKHSGARPYTCDVCHKSYLTANHLKNHVQAVHSSHKAYECPICDKRFPYDNSLKLHMRLHTGDRPFMCSICSKTFVSRSALKVHEATHVETKDFHCDLCDKSYKTEMLLHNHRRRHTEDGSRYMCDICGNTYMYKSNLEAHYDVHGDSRNHQCNICHKTFKTYPTLYSHYLVHSDKNPFSCTQCGKAFKTKERLKAHEVRHTGEKPYICESCGSCFPDKGGLSKHKKTVHAEAPRFGCPVCSKQCNRADNLRVHMKVHGNPELLKLSQEELYIKGKSADTSGKHDSELASSTTDPVVPVEPYKNADGTAPIQVGQHTSEGAPEPSQQTIHTLEAPRGLENLPSAQDTYQETQGADDHLTPGSMMGAQLMGVHPWGPDSALQYQNLLLAQGYPTAGLVQAQALGGETTDGRANSFHHTPTQPTPGHGHNSY